MTVERLAPMSDATPGFRLAMLADDLTGGYDAGVQFSLRGVANQVYLDLLPEPAAFARVSVLVKPMNSEVGVAKEPACWLPRVSAASVTTTEVPGPVVLCIGSTNPLTGQQVQRLADTKKCLTFDLQQDEPNRVQAALAGGDQMVVPLPPGSVLMGNLRHLLSATLNTSLGRGLFCSGGDTARLVCASLGVQAIQLGSEILPGLPWGRLVGGPADRLPISTKAGGFGNPEAICQAVNFLAVQSRLQGTR
jgi:uncharacterized protein YgbK (DUF1537 family)